MRSTHTCLPASGCKVCPKPRKQVHLTCLPDMGCFAVSCSTCSGTVLSPRAGMPRPHCPGHTQVKNATDVTSFGIRLNDDASSRIASASPDTGNLVPTYNDRGVALCQSPVSSLVYVPPAVLQQLCSAPQHCSGATQPQRLSIGKTRASELGCEQSAAGPAAASQADAASCNSCGLAVGCLCP